jgi:hypothetical protein
VCPNWTQAAISKLVLKIECSEGKILVTKIEFAGSLDTSLEGDFHEVEVTPNLELLVTFGMSLEGVCHELYTQCHYKLIPNLEVTTNS